MRGAPVRRPFPFDTVLGGKGLMLGQAKKGGPLVLTKPQDLTTVRPTDYSYTSQPPEFERITTYDQFVYGPGLDIQTKEQDQYYRYGLGVDTSIQGQIIKGPEIVTREFNVWNTSSFMFELNGYLYLALGNKVYRRTSEEIWTDVTPAGMGTIQDVVVFYPQDGGATARAWFAMGDSAAFRIYDGTTWTTQADGLKATSWCVIGKEFYRSHSTNCVTKCDVDADPANGAHWGAENAFYVGDKNSAIVSMSATAFGVLLIFKTDGIYTLDADGKDIKMFPHLVFTPHANNGKVVHGWLDDIYVTYGGGLFRISPDLSIQAIGMDMITGAQTPVTGHITALAGHSSFTLYAAIRNYDTGTCHLLKYGAWATNQEGQPTRIPVWNGSITNTRGTPAAPRYITSMFISRYGAPENHERMYLIYNDGLMGYFTLPCTANPLNCGQYRFSTADGTLYLPSWHAMYQADRKLVRSATVIQEVDAASSTSIIYRTDSKGSFVTLGDFTLGYRMNVEPSTEILSTIVDYGITLKNTLNTSTPVVRAMAIHYSVRPSLYFTFQFLVLANDRLLKRNGSPLRETAESIRQHIRNLVDAHGTTDIILPDESVWRVAVVGYEETMAWNERLKQWQSALRVTAVQHSKVLTGGTYGTLELFDYETLELQTYGALEKLNASRAG